MCTPCSLWFAWLAIETHSRQSSPVLRTESMRVRLMSSGPKKSSMWSRMSCLTTFSCVESSVPGGSPPPESDFSSAAFGPGTSSSPDDSEIASEGISGSFAPPDSLRFFGFLRTVFSFFFERFASIGIRFDLKICSSRRIFSIEASMAFISFSREFPPARRACALCLPRDRAPGLLRAASPRTSLNLNPLGKPIISWIEWSIVSAQPYRRRSPACCAASAAASSSTSALTSISRPAAPPRASSAAGTRSPGFPARR